MRKGRSRIVVLSNSSNSHFGYAGILNKLGYYSVSLCSGVREVVGLLGAGARFKLLLYDGFDLRKDANHLQMLVKYNAIESIIAVADVNSQQRKKIILWAKEHGLPLGGVLQAPLRSNELHELIQVNSHNAERCCAALVASDL